MRHSVVLALLSLVAFPSCSHLPGAGHDVPTEINVENLTQHWVHSREEEPHKSTVDVYRPSGSRDFPPSRFRMRYIFEDGGDRRWYYLAPNDAHHFRSGKWRVEHDLRQEQSNVLRIEQGENTVRYRVVELTDEVLRVSRIDTAAN